MRAHGSLHDSPIVANIIAIITLIGIELGKTYRIGEELVDAVRFGPAGLTGLLGCSSSYQLPVSAE